ncbi:MAG: hypothetical protein ACO1TE_24300 [Prosthecobacter sp.]
MLKHSDLGFADGVHSPILALELASDREEMQKLLYAPVDPAASDSVREQQQQHQCNDRTAARERIERDCAFIAGYMLLFVLLALRHWPRRPTEGISVPKVLVVLLALIPVLAGAADYLENFPLLDAIQEPSLASYDHDQLWWASRVKWALLFLFATCQGWAELRRPLTPRLAKALRALTGLLMLVSGLVGLCWLFSQHGLLIENGLRFLVVSLLLLPFWLWNPDAPWRSSPA